MPDLIKKFFDTFEIEPKEKNCKYYFGFKIDMCENCDKKTRLEYPEITDHILLELICILNPYCYSSGKNIQHLKESILEWCIKYKQDIKQQIQELFKGV